MEKNETESLRKMVYASLMAALTAAGAQIMIPVGPVPIVLQNLFVMLAGLLLGSRWGLASVGIYLLAGICGLPVFAAASGGFGRLIGPTGGYLLGYLPAVYLIGMISEQADGRALYDILAMIAGAVVVYAFGVSWLKVITGMSIAKSLAVGMYPFLIGDTLKIAAAVSIVKTLRPLISRHKTFVSPA
jgi:biotin transport system substrate-specific component